MDRSRWTNLWRQFGEKIRNRVAEEEIPVVAHHLGMSPGQFGIAWDGGTLTPETARKIARALGIRIRPGMLHPPPPKVKRMPWLEECWARRRGSRRG